MSVILSCRSVWICHDNLAISGTIQGDTAHLVTTAQTPEQKKFSCLPYYEQASSPIGHSVGLAWHGTKLARAVLSARVAVFS